MLAAAALLLGTGVISMSGQVAELHTELGGIGNGWTDVTKDWVGEAAWSQGLPGTGILDRVANAGLMTAWLDNDTRNSGGLLGYYSPDHANVRSGFRLGMRVRLVLTPPIQPEQPRVEFLGTTVQIMPVAGTKGQRQTRLDVLDWMDDAARARLEGVALQQDKRGHELFLTALAEAPNQPQAVEHDEFISETYPYAFDSAHDETTTVLAEFQRQAQSSLALIFMDGETLVYESRAVRARVTSDVDTFADTELQSMQTVRSRDDLINFIQMTLRPRRLGSTATEVLWQLQNAIKIVPGQVVDPVMGPYVDPTGRAKRVGGTDMVTPVATTDYVANSAEDGSGSVLTSSLSVTASIGANGVRFRLENTGTQDLWVGGTAGILRIRGRGIYYGEQALVEAKNADSEIQFGRNAAKMDMPYQSNLTLAGEAGQYFVSLLKDPLTRTDQVTGTAPLTDGARLDRLLRRRLSDRIGLSESVTGVDGSFFINRRTCRLTPVEFRVAWLLAPADATQYWLLEVVGRSELDVTTILGFGTIVGHTDLAHGDTHSDSAHTDVAHVDTAHGDAHTDTAHTDAGHQDAHSDVAHSDTAHSDAHTDVTHSDVAHSDVAHVDNHSDTAHSDVAHSDTAHSDAHGDFTDAEAGHVDTHVDVAHSDSHVDTAHQDSHNDVAHSDTAHSDVAHTDTHGDTLHADSHTDTHDDAVHGDIGHVDTHTDDAHVDTNHTDVNHGDSHTDTAHGDTN